jgi:hypothetical protein
MVQRNTDRQSSFKDAYMTCKLEIEFANSCYKRKNRAEKTNELDMSKYRRNNDLWYARSILHLQPFVHPSKTPGKIPPDIGILEQSKNAWMHHYPCREAALNTREVSRKFKVLVRFSG